jgi:hypothetical protein
MKLKPLLKTHWLASQNPMNVSLNGLQKIVFTPPRQVLDSEFSFDPNLGVEIPPSTSVKQLPADQKEVQEVMTQSFTLSRDLFWNLFSGFDLTTIRMPSTSLRLLARSLEFHFDDGECLSLVGIFRRQGLPLFLNPQFYLQDRSCNWAKALESHSEQLMRPLKIMGHQKKSDEFKKAWIVILEILAWSFQRKRQVGDLEVAWGESESSDKRIVYPLQEIEFLNPRPLAATIMAHGEVNHAAIIKIWQGSEKELPKSILRLHSTGWLADIEGSQAELLNIQPDEKKELASINEKLDWNPCFAKTEAGLRGISRTLAKLELHLRPDQIRFINHVSISDDQFKPFLKVRELDGSMQMAVSFGIETLKLRHLNFPSNIAPLFAPFLGGMDVYFGLDRKDAASRQTQFRTNDMLFLRHQGFAIFCLLEMLNWILKRPLSSGEQVDFNGDWDAPETDRGFEKIILHLKNSIPGLLGRTGSKFEELFSPDVRNLFLDFVEKMYQVLRQDRSLVFYQGQVGEIKNVQMQVLPLIRFMILHFVEASQGKFLTKSQSQVGEKFKQSLQFWTEPKILPEEMAEASGNPSWVDIGLYNKYIVALLFDLLDNGMEIEFNGKPFVSLDNPFEFIFSVGNSESKNDQNWFDLHPQIFFNGQKIDSEEIKFNFTPDQVGFIEYRGQMYRIDKKQVPTLKSLQKFWNKIKGDKTAVKHNSFGDKVYRLEKSQALELLMLKAQGVDVQGEGEWKRIFEYFEKGLGVNKINFPEVTEKSLLAHQKEGAQWLHDLYELKLGAILADEMGLGKTFQVLAFLSSLQSRELLKKCLIVVPTSLVYNWIDEKNKFAPDLPMRAFHAKDQKGMREALDHKEPLVVIATYGLLNENLEFFKSQEWNVLAFDEAQNLKNITSLRSISARSLKAQFKVCLTGTPMENNYLEFFSLCDLVVPGSLGDVDTFRKSYYNREVQIEALRELRLITKPLLLRRTKAQVKLSLPVKTVQKVLLPFVGQQKEIYKKMAMTFSRQVEELIQSQGERKAQIAMFAALMRLRQICSDPAAVPGVIYDEQPVKVEHFLSSLQEHLENKESVIVFTQFLSTLGRIERELQRLKVPSFVLQGQVSSKERVRLISAFQNSEEPGVMLMTLKTGGVGLNLTKASVVYHLEPWWNPAVENQATDRAHRMGQTKDVKVYNLLIEGSLEERIADLKLKKQGSFDRLFGVDEQIEDTHFEGAQSLSKDDFVYLLK